MKGIGNFDDYKQAVFSLCEGVETGRGDAAILLKNILDSEENAEFLAPIGFIATTFSLTQNETIALCVCAARLWLYKPLPTANELVDICDIKGERLHLLFAPQKDGGVLSRSVRAFVLAGERDLVDGAALYFPTPAELFHSQDILADIETFCGNVTVFANDTRGAVVLKGREGCGRTFLLTRLAERGGGTLLCVDAATASAHDADEIAITASLYRSIVCISHSTQGAQLIKKLSDSLSLLFFTENTTAPTLQNNTIVLERTIGELTYAQRKTAIATLFDLQDDELTAGLASKYSADMASLIKAKTNFTAQLLAGKVGAEDKTAISDTLKAACAGDLGDSADKVVTNKYLDDVILPIQQKKQLREICDFISNRKMVYEQWNFDSKIPYGKGITVLFYGASGTGKTLAATAMANELGLDLYRVDLSQLISKYIGETQKNIGRVFDAAKNCDCILFFDEADALFSRRTDTGDSQDKHSNAEIAYLLQRTERYDGPIILATNLLQNFDDAFRRRIGFMIHFPMPDENLRQHLWDNIFPSEAPIQELNTGMLAKHIELSGAGIRNCAVNAALLAASEGATITMSRIIRAAQSEYQKQSKPFPAHVTAMFPYEN